MKSKDGIDDCSLHDEVRILRALDDLLSDVNFCATDRNKKFLRFVVEQSLKGHGKRIKAYTIAVDVFGRAPDFDGNTDPIVRIEASRLRAALTAYYARSTCEPDVMFLLPKGRYVAKFVCREEMRPDRVAAADAFGRGAEVEQKVDNPGSRSAPFEAIPGKPDEAVLFSSSGRNVRTRRSFRTGWVFTAVLLGFVFLGCSLLIWSSKASGFDRPIILIDHVTVLDGDPRTAVLAATLEQSLAAVLAQFDGGTVRSLGIKEERTKVAAELASRSPYASLYAVSSGVRIVDDKVHFWWQLEYGKTREVVWNIVRADVWALDPQKLIEHDIAKQVAVRISGQNGLLKSYEAKIRKGPTKADYVCVLRASRSVGEITKKDIEINRNCLTATVARFPDNAEAWSYLALNYLQEFRSYSYTQEARHDALTQAEGAAKRSLMLAPFSALTYLTAADVAQANGDIDTVRRSARRALEISPDDPGLLTFIGIRLFALGVWDEGAELIKRGISQDPTLNPSSAMMLAVNCYRLGEYENAIDQLEGIRGSTSEDIAKPYLYYVVSAAAYGMTDNLPRAHESIGALLKLRPNYALEVKDDFRTRRMPESLSKQLTDGLRMAGLDIK